MISSSQLRQKFAQFFIKEGHQKVASSSLIPENDPTLLFANAGMNQFKDNFTGKAKPAHPRAVTIQKCVRAGGKHNDLENVGHTARHHTFFEMLGNFSFGDYFKKEAIRFAWKFLTVELGIPKDKLLITVHQSDEEARQIWHQQEGVPLERIFYLGDKDNFWEMGEYGPCGPCTEIFYDHGEAYSDGQGTADQPLKDEGRYVEIWNLVFMQFEKTPQGTNPLPKPSVDTGAGLERLSAVVQGVYWNYDTDLFQGIIKHLEALSGKSYQDPRWQAHFRIIADHARATTMLISDGVIPSTEGRGYVLRRILRRAVRYLHDLGLQQPTLHLLAPTVFESLGAEYPLNKQNMSLVQKIQQQEEEQFRQTLQSGLKVLEQELEQLKKSKQQQLSGKTAFKLYDTFGFPMDLTETILREHKLELDRTGFESAMEEQKRQSREHSQFKSLGEDKTIFYQLKEQHGASTFLGHDQLQLEAKLLALIPQDEQHVIAITDRTPFYPQGGGQVGDQGTLQGLTVIDALKPIDDFIIHVVLADTTQRQQLQVGQSVKLAVDAHKRQLTAQHHSATHLLQAALIKVLGNHIKQAGSQVTPQGLRFDFTHPQKVTEEQLKEVEQWANEQMLKGLTIEAQSMSKDQAIALGATALFGEKYGDVVRTITMKSNSVSHISFELCAGTHASNTRELLPFCILSETSLSTGVRRIEALTGETALQFLFQQRQLIKELTHHCQTPAPELVQRIQSDKHHLKELEKKVQLLEAQQQQVHFEQLIQKALAHPKRPSGILYLELDSTAFDWKILADQFVTKHPSEMLCLAEHHQDQTQFLCRIHKELSGKINLQSLLKQYQVEVVGIKAGGRPDQIQGSMPTNAWKTFFSNLGSIKTS